VPPLYLGVKLVGAAYLIWIGIRVLRGRPDVKGSRIAAAKSSVHSLWGGMALELLNPKTATFFVAFLPGFSNPPRGPFAPNYGGREITNFLDETFRNPLTIV
jgi:threonine/homoserine/homoserine lactone efflux protein